MKKTMRIAFFASHLLHWRVLLPVIIELAFRNHRIVVETSRPNWLGMPTWAMRHRPRFVEGINATSLRWVADLISYRNQWNLVQRSVTYHWGQSRDNDALVSTTKDIAALADRAKADGCRAVAVGYQHLPVVVDIGDRGAEVMPDAFCPGHPFATLHRFSQIYGYGRVRACGFPHLDSVHAGPDRPKDRAVLICHPGGGNRGLEGSEWLHRLVCTLKAEGYSALIATHPIPGKGAGPDDIAALGVVPPSAICQGWWPAGDECRYILTFGSSSMYEIWSAGFRNAFVVGYVGSGRSRPFGVLDDVCLQSEADLISVLRDDVRPWSDFTLEVMDAYRSVHDGRGAKRAADMIEGRRL